MRAEKGRQQQGMDCSCIAWNARRWRERRSKSYLHTPQWIECYVCKFPCIQYSLPPQQVDLLSSSGIAMAPPFHPTSPCQRNVVMMKPCRMERRILISPTHRCFCCCCYYRPVASAAIILIRKKEGRPPDHRKKEKKEKGRLKRESRDPLLS